MSFCRADTVAFDEDEAITRHCRKRALQTGWNTERHTPAASEGPSANGQDVILAALDWSLRLAARWHRAAIGPRACD